MSYPHTTMFKPIKVIGETEITPSGVVIDLSATVTGQPDDAFEVQLARVVEFTNKSADAWVEVAFYESGSTVTPTYGDGIAIPPASKVAYALPAPTKTVVGAVTDTGETVALSTVCGHGL